MIVPTENITFVAHLRGNSSKPFAKLPPAASRLRPILRHHKRAINGAKPKRLGNVQNAFLLRLELIKWKEMPGRHGQTMRIHHRTERLRLVIDSIEAFHFPVTSLCHHAENIVPRLKIAGGVELERQTVWHQVASSV